MFSLIFYVEKRFGMRARTRCFQSSPPSKVLAFLVERKIFQNVRPVNILSTRMRYHQSAVSKTKCTHAILGVLNLVLTDIGIPAGK